MHVTFLAIDAKLIELAIILIIAILGGIGSIVNKIKTIGQPPPGRNPARPALPNRPARPEGGTVQEQIEEFLRRAQQRQVSKPAAQAQPAQQPIEAELIEDAPVGGRVTRQVRQYMDSSEFARRSAQMGDEVVQSDQQFTRQVQQAFSGEVSTLAKRPGEAAQAPQIDEVEPADDSKPMVDALPLPGEGLGDLFADPQNLVQAIIMNEILQRRDWS
jgi:hypothetical protein